MMQIKRNNLSKLLTFLAAAGIWSLLSNIQLRQRYGIVLLQETPSQDTPPQEQNMVSTIQIQNVTLPPEHCASQPPIQEIIIKGERHTGTNWVRVILEKSKDETKNIRLDCDGKHTGWKHGFLPPEGWGRPYEPSDLLVVVTRDVFTWLPKMYQQPYEPELNKLVLRQIPFHEFIKIQVVGIVHNHAHDHIKNKETSQYYKEFLLSEKVKRLTNLYGQYAYEDPMTKKKGIYIGEVAANLIQMRTEKYKNWLSGNPAVETYNGFDNRVHIRMEDLTDSSIHEDAAYRQLNTVIQPVSRHCVPMKADFSPVLARTKFPGYEANEKVYDSEYERKRLLSHYSKEEFRFVLSQLDMEFEKKLGYNYDYVYERLK